MTPELMIHPKLIALHSSIGSAQSTITVKNSTGSTLKILSIDADNPHINLNVETISETEAKILINLKMTDFSDKHISAKIFLKTNIGSAEIPYKFILNENN